MFEHPIHSIFVHFPAALVPTSAIFFILFIYTRKQVFEIFSIILLNISIFFTLIAILTGIYDWQIRFNAGFVPPIMIKLFLSLILFTLGILIYLIRKSKVRKYGSLRLIKSPFYILLNFILSPIVITIGYFGGDLIYHSSIRFSDSNLNTGSELFYLRCNSCHPNGQSIQSSFWFPADSSGHYGSASLINSPLLHDQSTFINYVRKPARMPGIKSNSISDYNLKSIFNFINFLKTGDTSVIISKSAEKTKTDTGAVRVDTLKLGKEIFSRRCSGCHPNGRNVIEGCENFKIIGSKKLLNGLNGFENFIFDLKFRIINSKMPLFTKKEIPSEKIGYLYNYLLTLK